MRRVNGLPGAALALLLGLPIVGCAPKEEPAAQGPVTPAGRTDSTAAAKIETATLKAVGMH